MAIQRGSGGTFVERALPHARALASQKASSAFLVAVLTLALAVAGVVFQPTAQLPIARAATQTCATGFSLVATAGTYKNYCYNNVTASAAESLTVPTGITTLVVTAVGGGGSNGGGGYDGCCGNDGSGGGGVAGDRLALNMAVTPGDVLGFYPGGKGGAGVTNSGVATLGGVSTYSASYNGGGGGVGGTRGGSGGAGGAATVITSNGAVWATVAGGGGGGGAGYCGANGGGAQAFAAVAGGASTGGTGTNGGFEAGGGGGGGGGSVGGAGGITAVGGSGTSCSGRTYGLGGKRGSSQLTTGSVVVHNANVAGFVDVYYSPLPVATIVLNAETTPPTENSWTYKVTFTPTVTGFDAADLAMYEDGALASGWTIGAPVVSGSDYLVTVSKSGLVDGTKIALGVDQTGVNEVNFGAAGIGVELAADFTVDGLAPTVTSMDITPDLVTANKISVLVTLSEPAYSLDLTKLTATGTSTTWTLTKPAFVSGSSTYTFTAVSSAVTDGTLILNAAAGFATDMVGHPLATAGAFTETVNTTVKPSVTSFTPRQTVFSAASVVYDLEFNRPIYGLAAADITFVTNAGCSTTPVVAGSGYAYTVTVTGCTTSAAVKLRVAANSVKDKVSILGPAAAFDSAIATRDATAPTISAVWRQLVSETEVEYRITFSEPVTGMSPTAITLSGTSASSGTWTISQPTLTAVANQYSFTATNPNAVTGTLKAAVSTTAVTDAAGNALAAGTKLDTGYDLSEALVVRKVSLTLGTLGSLGAIATEIAPNATLDAKGGSIYSFRVQVSNFKTGDVLEFTSASSSGTVTTASSSTGKLDLRYTGAQPTEAQWQDAMRRVKFRTTSTDKSARSFKFDLRPVLNYNMDNKHFYEFSRVRGLISVRNSVPQTFYFLGMQGYEASIADCTENQIVQDMAHPAGVLGVKITGPDTSTGSGCFASGEPSGNGNGWDNWAVAGRGWLWDDDADFSAAFLVEFGRPGDTFWDMSQTASAGFDTTKPELTSLTTPNSPAKAGMAYTLTFSEGITGLAAADFNFTGSTATGCAATPATTSGTVITVNVTCSTDGSIKLNLNANSVTDLAGNTGPTAATNWLNTVTQDSVAPTASAGAASSVANSVTQVFDFTLSEDLGTLVAGDFAFGGTSGLAGGWSVSSVVLVAGNQWRVTTTNSDPTSGTLQLLAKAGHITDAAGNQVSTSPLAATTVSFQPIINMGSLTPSNGTGLAFASSAVISDRGTGLYGIKITEATPAVGDVLSFVNNNAATFGTITASMVNGSLVLGYSGARPSIAQWQAALRAVGFATTAQSAADRNITIELDAYDPDPAFAFTAASATGILSVDTLPPYLTLTATNANQTGPSVSWSLASSEDIDCNTVSASDFTLTGLTALTVTRIDSKTCRISATTTAIAQGASGTVTLAVDPNFSVADAAGNAATGVITALPVLLVPADTTPVTSSSVTVTVPDSTAPALVSFTPTAQTSSVRSLEYVLVADEDIDCASLSAADFTVTGGRFVSSAPVQQSTTSCVVKFVATGLAGQSHNVSVNLSQAYDLADTVGNRATPPVQALANQVVAVNVPLASGSGSIIATTIPGTTPAQVIANAPAMMAQSGPGAAAAMLALKIAGGTPSSPMHAFETDISYATASDPIALQKAETIEAGDQVKFQVKVGSGLSATHDVVGYLKSGGSWVYIGRSDFAADLMVTSPVTFADIGVYVMKYYVVLKNSQVITQNIRSKSAPSPSPILKPAALTTGPLALGGGSLRIAAITDSDLASVSDKSLEVTVTVTQGAAGLPQFVQPAVPAAPITPTPSVTSSATPTPTPSASASVSPRPTASASPRPTRSPSAAVTSTPTPRATATPTPSASASATTLPSATPVPSVDPSDPAAVAAELSPIAGITDVTFPSLDPGAAIADPAIGATGDDAADPQPFDALSSPETIAAVTATASQVAALAAGVAAAAGAAAAAAGAAAGAAGAAGATGSGSSSSASGSSTRGAAGASTEGSSSEQIGSLDFANDEITIDGGSAWGDRLAIFGIGWMTFLDRRSHTAAERAAHVSPLLAKFINDGAYLRSMFGSLAVLPILASAVLGFTAGITGEPVTQIPGWQPLLALALLGVFDAAAGFVGALSYALANVLVAGFHWLDSITTLLATTFIAVGPAMIATALRGIRKQHAADFASWWERATDAVVIPFMSGWSVYTIVAVTPAVTGVTNNSVNHVRDFALFVAAAGFVRVLGEEAAARWFPARLDRINPDSFVEPSLIQRLISLALRYAFWLLASSAIFGFGTHVLIGSTLFIIPTVLGWFADRFPNSPRLWKLLPIGVPGLAFALVLSASTSALLAAVFGATPSLAEWSFAITPLPLLAFSILGMFGRHGANADDDKPIKKLIWVYRLGGVFMFALTLKLAGLF